MEWVAVTIVLEVMQLSEEEMVALVAEEAQQIHKLLGLHYLVKEIMAQVEMVVLQVVPVVAQALLAVV